MAGSPPGVSLRTTPACSSELQSFSSQAAQEEDEEGEVTTFLGEKGSMFLKETTNFGWFGVILFEAFNI